MGCVLSVDPKVDEVLKAIEKDAVPSKISTSMSSSKIVYTTHKIDPEECDDFEEGYSDDEMFTAVDHPSVERGDKEIEEGHYFRSWILDICFKNMGWIFRGSEVVVSIVSMYIKKLLQLMTVFPSKSVLLYNCRQN